jgi:hypothetical protein
MKYASLLHGKRSLTTDELTPSCDHHGWYHAGGPQAWCNTPGMPNRACYPMQFLRAQRLGGAANPAGE